MVASGIPIINGNQHAVEIAKMALDLLGKKGITHLWKLWPLIELSNVPLTKRRFSEINGRVH